MKVRALGSQLTFYDDDFNVIGEYPERPPEDPNMEVRMINIVDFEDRLMGIDPNAKPDFFIDVENDDLYNYGWMEKKELPQRKFIKKGLLLFLSLFIIMSVLTVASCVLSGLIIDAMK